MNLLTTERASLVGVFTVFIFRSEDFECRTAELIFRKEKSRDKETRGKPEKVMEMESSKKFGKNNMEFEELEEGEIRDESEEENNVESLSGVSRGNERERNSKDWSEEKEEASEKVKKRRDSEKSDEKEARQSMKRRAEKKQEIYEKRDHKDEERTSLIRALKDKKSKKARKTLMKIPTDDSEIDSPEHSWSETRKTEKEKSDRDTSLLSNVEVRHNYNFKLPKRFESTREESKRKPKKTRALASDWDYSEDSDSERSRRNHRLTRKESKKLLKKYGSIENCGKISEDSDFDILEKHKLSRDASNKKLKKPNSIASNIDSTDDSHHKLPKKYRLSRRLANRKLKKSDKRERSHRRKMKLDSSHAKSSRSKRKLNEEQDWDSHDEEDLKYWHVKAVLDEFKKELAITAKRNQERREVGPLNDGGVEVNPVLENRDEAGPSGDPEANEPEDMDERCLLCNGKHVTFVCPTKFTIGIMKLKKAEELELCPVCLKQKVHHFLHCPRLMEPGTVCRKTICKEDFIIHNPVICLNSEVEDENNAEWRRGEEELVPEVVEERCLLCYCKHETANCSSNLVQNWKKFHRAKQLNLCPVCLKNESHHFIDCPRLMEPGAVCKEAWCREEFLVHNPIICLYGDIDLAVRRGIFDHVVDMKEYFYGPSDDDMASPIIE